MRRLQSSAALSHAAVTETKATSPDTAFRLLSLVRQLALLAPEKLQTLQIESSSRTSLPAVQMSAADFVAMDLRMQKWRAVNDSWR
jgi:hypothetical protein